MDNDTQLQGALLKADGYIFVLVKRLYKFCTTNYPIHILSALLIIYDRNFPI